MKDKKMAIKTITLMLFMMLAFGKSIQATDYFYTRNGEKPQPGDYFYVLDFVSNTVRIFQGSYGGGYQFLRTAEICKRTDATHQGKKVTVYHTTSFTCTNNSNYVEMYLSKDAGTFWGAGDLPYEMYVE